MINMLEAQSTCSMLHKQRWNHATDQSQRRYLPTVTMASLVRRIRADNGWSTAVVWTGILCTKLVQYHPSSSSYTTNFVATRISTLAYYL